MTPQPRQSDFVVLWATSKHYSEPQFVTAWPEGLVDAWHDWYLELREKAERDYSDFAVDDGPWTFWTTPESIATPEGAPDDVALAVMEPNR